MNRFGGIIKGNIYNKQEHLTERNGKHPRTPQTENSCFELKSCAHGEYHRTNPARHGPFVQHSTKDDTFTGRITDSPGTPEAPASFRMHETYSARRDEAHLDVRIGLIAY